MTGAQFRVFQDGRPDHERWELIAGVAMMMTPPKLAHNIIAGNLERLLTAALAAHDPKRLATQRVGIELAGIDDYKPEPDVGVIDADYRAEQRYVDRIYLAAEVVSRRTATLLPRPVQKRST
jgi:Uma2 family endonuclease